MVEGLKMFEEALMKNLLLKLRFRKFLKTKQ